MGIFDGLRRTKTPAPALVAPAPVAPAPQVRVAQPVVQPVAVPVAAAQAAPAAPAACCAGGGGVKISAPLTGRVIPLSEVPDPVFSQGMMGQGVAIVPTEGRLVAPFDGEVSAIFPTGHAVGLTHPSGAEILMHVGVDTVNLKGQHFTSKVVQGQHVKAGDTLVEFDIPAIEAAGYSLATPVLVTNGDDFPGMVKAIESGAVTAGAPLYSVSK